MKILLNKYKITGTKQHSVQAILMDKKNSILEIQCHIRIRMQIINPFHHPNIEKFGKIIKNK